MRFLETTRKLNEEEEDIYLAQTMTTIAHNRTIILIGLLSQNEDRPILYSEYAAIAASSTLRRIAYT